MRILCLGNNTEDTDHRTKKLAQNSNHLCYGLVSSVDGCLSKLELDGYYHTSVYDLTRSELLELAKQFDQVIVLDQPRECYSHPNAFYNTISIAKEIASCTQVIYLDPSYKQNVDLFNDLVTTNKSFCIFPFIELLVQDGHTTVCCRSKQPITTLKDLRDFKTDPSYQHIRQKMLQGELLPKHCSACYNLENMGATSPRKLETVEWANRLNLTTLDDLNNLTAPVYYEVRPSNKCNLQCRMCNPEFSHLIGKEYQKLNLVTSKKEFAYENFDFVKLDQLQKLYVSGGEPSIMAEFNQFLDSCIKNNKIDFELLINTNAVKFSDLFKKRISHFKNCQFIISIDGYNELNHYIRWPSLWEDIIRNARYLVSNNHKITFNVTISIYNVAQLFSLFNFFDEEFPSVIVHGQLESHGNESILSPTNHPNKESVLDDLAKVTKTNCYKNSVDLQLLIDSLINFYQQSYVFDSVQFKKFLDFNDKLDQSRNIKLADYIPALADGRCK